MKIDITRDESDFLTASRNGDIHSIIKFVDKFGSLRINQICNAAGNTALHLATLNGQVRCIQYLVMNCANMYSLNNSGESPLGVACLKIPPLVHQDKAQLSLDIFRNIVDIFVNNGFDLNRTAGNSTSYLGKLALYGATDAMKILIDFGAQIDIVDQFLFTPLHCASVKGHFYKEQVEAFKLLVKNGAKLISRTHKGDTILDLATESNHSDIIALMLEIDLEALSLSDRDKDIYSEMILRFNSLSIKSSF